MKEELIAFSINFISIVFALPLPLFVKYILDVAIADKSLALLSGIVLSIVAFYAIQTMLEFLSDCLFVKIRKEIIFTIRSKLYEHLLRLPMQFHDVIKSGQLSSRVLSDVDALHGLFPSNISEIVKNTFIVIVVLLIFANLNLRIAILFCVLILVFIAVFVVFNQYLKNASKNAQDRMEIFSGNLNEDLLGVRLIKSFAREDIQSQLISDKIKNVEESRRKRDILNSTFRSVAGVVIALGSLIIWWYGGYEAIKGDITIGTLIAFSLYLGYLYPPLVTLLLANVSFQSSLASAIRIFEVLDTNPEVIESKNAISVPMDFRGDIKFMNVSFAYADKHILDKINITIKEGAKIAFVGASGVGKTTIINLLLRFYDPQSGSISIGCHNIKNLHLHSLRKLIGLVSQDVFLFDTTVGDNIAIGKENATDEEIISAAKMANAHNFIMTLPQGYKTVIGERGIRLSGGQRQRLTIAQTILKNSQIIILDEPTAFLDPDSEQQINQLLQSLFADRTVIIISHRLTTIVSVDTIFFIHNSKIIDEGTHDEVIRRNAIYQKFYDGGDCKSN